jgi:hypothetical protein
MAEARIPCEDCPDPEDVIFVPGGHFTNDTTDLMNNNFRLLQCLIDLCQPPPED